GIQTSGFKVKDNQAGIEDIKVKARLIANHPLQQQAIHGTLLLLIAGFREKDVLKHRIAKGSGHKWDLSTDSCARLSRLCRATPQSSSAILSNQSSDHIGLMAAT